MSTGKFPLYDNLVKNVIDKDLTAVNKQSFIKKIDKLDRKGQEMIYALIRMYQIENNEDSLSLPYGGLMNDNNIVYDLDKLPNKLKQI